jgi:hypothetical protein
MILPRKHTVTYITATLDITIEETSLFLHDDNDDGMSRNVAGGDDNTRGQKRTQAMMLLGRAYN